MFWSNGDLDQQTSWFDYESADAQVLANVEYTHAHGGGVDTSMVSVGGGPGLSLFGTGKSYTFGIDRLFNW